MYVEGYIGYIGVILYLLVDSVGCLWPLCARYEVWSAVGPRTRSFVVSDPPGPRQCFSSSRALLFPGSVGFIALVHSEMARPFTSEVKLRPSRAVKTQQSS